MLTNQYWDLDKNKLISMAGACIQTYKQFKYNGSFSIPNGYKLVQTFKAKVFRVFEWFGYVMESEDNAIIAFRGSLSKRDWITDLGVSQTNYQFAPHAGKVHTGFNYLYKSCREDVLNTLESMSPHLKIYITGHSLGGALAVLNALDIAVNTKHKNPVMISFGAPRTGNPDFASVYNHFVKNSIRVVSDRDLTPKSPNRVILSPIFNKFWIYKHVNHPYIISFEAGGAMANHDIRNYIKQLRGK
ncbi:lipase family protein [Desulfoscipio sp. XC116]|uniref:lipase family protein n=1 Tax=Desulfoscipio sp. XC116 TaxID=3144975 RepID=UPI00325B9089